MAKRGPKVWGEDRTYAVTYQAEYKRCYKPGCRCENVPIEEAHGPYWYRYQFDPALKRVVKTYLGKNKPAEAEGVPGGAGNGG